MKMSPKRILWWGIGFLILGAIAFYVYTSVGFQTALASTQTSQALWFWLFSPGLNIIQNAAFPLGAVLIGASVVMRYIASWQSSEAHQPSERSELDT
ncbi:hypothetical protein GCM10023190_13620 [Enteractinococcus fodinae]|uniref:Uncharacterized protein n=1 Tax=Enteractinococcus fodinae TaxID=684663 RepID=A0ABU2AXS9_9MICC|nr:hypothetical protein [Enteractinococcus fodinae]MDR7346162.1 hypothetical protein [Enteractinococcus fodinae]